MAFIKPSAIASPSHEMLASSKRSADPALGMLNRALARTSD